jgi:hypothetical protein
MAIVPRHATPPYIGPILSDSGEDEHERGDGEGASEFPYESEYNNEYDLDEAELEFKKFKTRVRIEKIVEFHREAAEMEVRLVVDIERMRMGGVDVSIRFFVLLHFLFVMSSSFFPCVLPGSSSFLCYALHRLPYTDKPRTNERLASPLAAPPP